jgi:hypothetical protein
MFEVLILLLAAFVIAAWFGLFSVFKSLGNSDLKIQREIEATLFPRPTDSVLRRHYDALVAAEVENRLASVK